MKFQLALQDHNYVSKIPPTPSPPPPPPLPVLQPPTVLQVTQDGRKRLQSGGVVVPAGPAAPGQGSNAAQTAQSSAVQAAAAANLPMHPNPSFNSNPNLRGLVPELPLPSRSTSATTVASTAATLSPAAASSATPGGGRLVLQQPQQQPQQPQQPPQKPAQTATSSPAGLLNAVTGQPGKIPIWNTILINEVYILRHIMYGSSIKHGWVKIDPFFLIWLYLPTTRLGMMNRF